MAYTEITSDLISNPSLSVQGIGTIAITHPGTFKFVSSSVTGTIYPEGIRGTCFSSNNWHTRASSAVSRFDVTLADSSVPVKVKLAYVTCAQTSYDYAMFGHSGRTFNGQTYYASLSDVMYHTRTAQNMDLREIEYVLTANTFFYVEYKKNDDNTNRGIDKLAFKIYVDRLVNEKFYYYGYWLQIRGFGKNIANWYPLQHAQGAIMSFDGLSLPDETNYDNESTQQQKIYCYLSGSTSGMCPSPNNVLISCRANGHKSASIHANLAFASGTTQSEAALSSAQINPMNFTKQAFLRQYLIGLGVINGVGDGCSHFKVVATNNSTGQYLSGKTGTGGYIRLYSSAFTTNGTDVTGTIVGTRDSYQTIEGTIPHTTGYDTVSDYSYARVFNGSNTGRVVTFKDIETLDSGLDTPTGENAQLTAKYEDVGNVAKGNIVLNTYVSDLSTNQVICWDKIRTLGNTQYFTDDTVGASPDWSGETIDNPGTYISVSGGVFTTRKSIGISNQTTDLVFTGSPVKIATLTKTTSNKAVSATVPSVFITSVQFEMTSSPAEVVGYDSVDYEGSKFFVSSGTSTTPIGTAVTFSDAVYEQLITYFTDPILTANTFNGSIALKKDVMSALNVVYNSKTNNQYYLYFQPCVVVNEAICQGAGTNSGIVGMHSFQIPNQSVEIL